MTTDGLRSWEELNAAAATLTQADLDGMSPVITAKAAPLVDVSEQGADAIFKAGRRHWLATPIGERPNLADWPYDLFTRAEQGVLMADGQWPLSKQQLDAITMSPAAEMASRERERKRILDLIGPNILAAIEAAVETAVAKALAKGGRR